MLAFAHSLEFIRWTRPEDLVPTRDIIRFDCVPDSAPAESGTQSATGCTQQFLCYFMIALMAIPSLS